MQPTTQWPFDSLKALIDALSTRRVSAEEVVRDALEKTAELNSDLNAFISVDGKGALKQAENVDARRVSGEELHPLAGVPLAIKDNISVEGLLLTAGSRMLSTYVAPYDATVVSRVKDAGMVIVGKTNMDEFGMGSTTETSYFGPTKNPWDRTKVPGGSSGGSAAAVAAGMVPIALGSDTGGSVRQPAAHCGVTGLKPTYGSVSRYGLIAYVSSFDQVGVIAREPEDVAAILEVMMGHDAKDSTSVSGGREWNVRKAGKGKLRIGVPEDAMGTGLDAECRDAVIRAASIFEDLGTEVVYVQLPLLEYAIPTYYLIATSEASANLARYDGVKFGYRAPEYSSIWEMFDRTRAEGFAQEVKRRIILGTFALSAGYYGAFYLKAAAIRSRIQAEYRRLFQAVDVLLMPVTPSPAQALGATLDDPLSMYLSDMYTVSANLAGIPAMTVPFALAGSGLPIAIQLQGPHFAEGLLVDCAERLAGARGTFPRPLVK